MNLNSIPEKCQAAVKNHESYLHGQQDAATIMHTEDGGWVANDNSSYELYSMARKRDLSTRPGVAMTTGVGGL